MYIALKNDYPTFVPPANKAGLLTPWADRGVLMLNTCLTVRAHEANSHSNRGWERFTQKVIDLVAARRTKGVVFLAWGTPAGKRVLKVDGKRHLVLKSVHPSPLSASRGFFTCGHFKMANEWLAERYGVDGRVDWALVEGGSVLKAGGEEEEKKKVEDVKKEEGEDVKKEGSVVKKVEAVVKAAVVGAAAAVGGDAENRETGKETEVGEKKNGLVKAEGDENAAPGVEA
jgi:uracil-DNA glycosylase